MALAAAALVSADAVPKGIVLWPHQAQKRSDLSSAISLEFSYALPCDIVSGTNATGALVCDWSRFEALLDGIASRRHQAVIRIQKQDIYPSRPGNSTLSGTDLPLIFRMKDPDPIIFYRQFITKLCGAVHRAIVCQKQFILLMMCSIIL